MRPINEAKEVISIGPKNQAKGILKYSAIMALGIDIMMTDINGIENTPNISEEYLYRSSDNFYDFLIFGALLLVSIIIFLWVFFSYSNKNYVLIDNEIIHAKGTLTLSETEANLISLFVNKNSLANSKVMSLFTEKSKTKDYAVKRKNRTLTNLNKRFSELYGTYLFYNQKSKTDSRQTNYLLNQKINLKRN